ncbi:hypothetical protein [Variovorax sp. DAIF25]|uniref:hypothetical protein n=1 Tax=Variovorax sp. DAIF25 TaxID=3080983 RepID=UPI003D6AF081
MAKKQSTAVAVAPAAAAQAETAHVVRFEISDNVIGFASGLGVDLTAPLEERADLAAQHMNRSQRHMLAAGLLLASMKNDCQHGEFLVLIGERGFEERAAQRSMQYAQFVLSRSDAEREFLLGQPQSKVLALASADAAVIESLLADGEEGDLDSLSVRALRQRIKDAEAQLADLAVERDTAQAERDGLAKKLKKRARDAEDHDGTPEVVADIRAEQVALLKKAELSIESLHPVLVELVGYSGHELMGVWVHPTVRLALSGLVALRILIDGKIKACADALGDDEKKLQSQPDSLAFLDAGEIAALAEEFPRLITTHQYEADQRAHERKQAKPRGKGRPEAAPKAPEVK